MEKSDEKILLSEAEGSVQGLQGTDVNAFGGSQKVTVIFMLLSVLFVVCLIVSNLIEIKVVDLGWFTITAGFVVFPISYIINDCLVEVWGYRKARLVIWLGFLMNFLFVAFGAAADALPGAAYWTGEAGFHAIFGLAPRITAASFAAFLAGSFVNAYVMSRMKRNAPKGRGFSLRAILSTVAGESVDSLIFFPLALGGVVPWQVLPVMMLTQVLLKTLYEIIVLPLTVRIVRLLKRIEGEDVIDDNVRYGFWRITDL